MSAEQPLETPAAESTPLAISPLERPAALTGSEPRLYACQLRLRPLQKGTLMPFNGELVHGAFLHWLRASAPEVAAWLHEGQKRRLFTCSSLQFPYPQPRMLRAQRENIHLPLDPEQTYTIRITLLLGGLLAVFHDALMHSKAPVPSGPNSPARPPFFQLGKQLLLLEEVVLTEDHPGGWCGFVSPLELVEQAARYHPGRVTAISLEFASLTTFNHSNKHTYGQHYLLVPWPHAVYQYLARRWEELAPPELSYVVNWERIEPYLVEEGAILYDYELEPHEVAFTTHRQRGFIGRCTYHLRGPDDRVTAEAPLTIRQQLYLLSKLAFYCGVGYKTAQGMGQVRLIG